MSDPKHTIADTLPQDRGQVLGVINNPRLTDTAPQGEATVWEGGALSEPPPPWELPDSTGLLESDAKRFVDCPENIVVRWINPRMLDSMGWRDWQPVSASDPRFTVRVKTMISPENQIRRGGMGGDILAWMYRSWVESRRRLNATATAKQAQTAADSQAALEEKFRREYGSKAGVTLTKFPTHTNVATAERD